MWWLKIPRNAGVGSIRVVGREVKMDYLYVVLFSVLLASRIYKLSIGQPVAYSWLFIPLEILFIVIYVSRLTKRAARMGLTPAEPDEFTLDDCHAAGCDPGVGICSECNGPTRRLAKS